MGKLRSQRLRELPKKSEGDSVLEVMSPGQGSLSLLPSAQVFGNPRDIQGGGAG